MGHRRRVDRRSNRRLLQWCPTRRITLLGPRRAGGSPKRWPHDRRQRRKPWQERRSMTRREGWRSRLMLHQWPPTLTPPPHRWRRRCSPRVRGSGGRGGTPSWNMTLLRGPGLKAHGGLLRCATPTARPHTRPRWVRQAVTRAIVGAAARATEKAFAAWHTVTIYTMATKAALIVHRAITAVALEGNIGHRLAACRTSPIRRAKNAATCIEVRSPSLAVRQIIAGMKCHAAYRLRRQHAKRPLWALATSASS